MSGASSDLHVVNPDYRRHVEEIFRAAAFVQHLGIRLVSVSPGRCETVMTVRSEHRQQDGFVHAGVLFTLADHSGGGSAGTLVAADEGVLSTMVSMQLLRAAKADELRCVGEVLRAGRRIIACDCSVFAGDRLVVKLAMTLTRQTRSKESTGG